MRINPHYKQLLYKGLILALTLLKIGVLVHFAPIKKGEVIVKQLTVLALLIVLSGGAQAASDNSEAFQVKLKCAPGHSNCKQKVEKSKKDYIDLNSALESAEQDMLIAKDSYSSRNY